MSLTSEKGKQSHYVVLSGWEQNCGKKKTKNLNSLALMLLSLVSWCIKRGICPSWGFPNPLKYYWHVVIVALIPLLLDCMTVILLITQSATCQLCVRLVMPCKWTTHVHVALDFSGRSRFRIIKAQLCHPLFLTGLTWTQVVKLMLVKVSVQPFFLCFHISAPSRFLPQNVQQHVGEDSVIHVIHSK